MITTYIRSSQLNLWVDACEHRTYLEYNIGLGSSSNKKTEMGTIFHRVFEHLAIYKKAQQDGLEYFDDDMMGRISTKEPVNIGIILDIAYKYYSSKRPELDWCEKDRETCLAWINKGLAYNNGIMDPRKAEVIQPEKYFDIEIPYEWAEYDYKYKDTNIKGKLHLKGTIDLVVKINDNTYELIDYKSGRRFNWHKSTEKDFDDLYNDKQLRFYYYAARLIYPEIENLLITIYYVNDGGSYTLAFDDGCFKETEQYLRDKFTEMSTSLIPRKNVTWRCGKFCKHCLNHTFNEKVNDCDFIHQEILSKGIKKTNELYIKDINTITSYGSGGGKEAGEQRK